MHFDLPIGIEFNLPFPSKAINLQRIVFPFMALCCKFSGVSLVTQEVLGNAIKDDIGSDCTRLHQIIVVSETHVSRCPIL